MTVEPDDVMFHLLIRGGEQYIFLYRKKYRHQLLRRAYQQACDDELSFDDKDWVSLALRVMESTDGDEDFQKFISEID